MDNDFLDESTYEALLSYINNLHFEERKGSQKDLKFLSDDNWLKDSAVIDLIRYRKGLWEIQLVFAHCLHPYTLIKRSISQYTCSKKANLFAWYMKRLAAKDQRGTLEVDMRSFNFCNN